jgi:hypothetical protein
MLTKRFQSNYALVRIALEEAVSDGVLDAKTQRCSLEKAQIIVRDLKLT